MSVESRRAALKRFMRERGLKPYPWAKSAGISEGTLRAFLNEKNPKTRALRHDTLEKLADSQRVTIAEMIGEQPNQPRQGREIVTVQGLKVQAALGGGVAVSDEAEGDPFYFRRQFIDRVARGGAKQLRVIELKGDSMLPALADGDVALIDTQQTDVVAQPGLYCIWTGTGLAVKRLTAVPGARPKFRIQSDNKQLYPDPDIVDADEVRVIGRVIWRGGSV